MMKSKKAFAVVMIILLIINTFTQTTFAAINGDASSGRYINLGLYNEDGTLIMNNNLLSKADNSKNLKIKGNYDVSDILGENVEIKYSIDSVKDVVGSGTIKSFKVDNTNKEGTFEDTLVIKRGDSCTGDEICFPDGSSTYQLTLYVVYELEGEEQVFVYLKQDIKIESSVEEPFKMNSDDYVIGKYAGDFEAYVNDVSANNSISNKTYLFSDLLNPKEFEIKGHLKIDLEDNTKIVVGYDVIDFDSYLNKKYDEGLVYSYSQTEYTKDNYVTFNKKFFLKIKNEGEVESSDSPINLLPKDNRSYVIRVTVKSEDGTTKIEDFPFNVFENNLTEEEMEERANIDRELNKDLQEINDEGLDYTIKYNGNDLENLELSDLRNGLSEIELDGKILSNLPLNKDVLVMYDITSVDNIDYIEENERIIKRFSQNEYTRVNPVEFNRTLKFTVSDDKSIAKATEEYPIVKLHDYPANYILAVNVYFRDNEGEPYKHYKRLIKEFNVNGSKQDFEFIDDESLKFNNPTKLDVNIKKYDGSNLKSFDKLEYEDIKDNPVKINLEGILNNGANLGNNISVTYDLTSYESYVKKSGSTNLLKTYNQTADSRLRNVEFNKNIYISTSDREDKSGDELKNTIYLDTDTRYYTITVYVKDETSKKVIIQRDFTFLMDSGGEAKQETEKPGLDIPDGLSAYFIDEDGNYIEEYEITARALNEASNGVKLDLTGYVTENWTNSEVKLDYDLVALDEYTNYTKSDEGEITTLLKDPNNLTEPNLPIASGMIDWLGKDKQLGFIERYLHDDYIKDKSENFSKTLTLHTKLDKDKENLKDDDSRIFLDNTARNYLLKVNATNITNGEVSEKTIKLNVVTEKDANNVAPSFDSPMSVLSPKRGSGYFVDELIPLSWIPANDKENELLYYKIYYYYSTLEDASGQIQKFMKIYEDMPKDGDILSTYYKLDMTTKIEPVYIKIIACDVNHECSDETRSNPFKLNEFGIDEGGGGNNGGGGDTIAVPVEITINPAPTNEWYNKELDISVFMNGSSDVLRTAKKRYDITQSPVIPPVLSKTLPSNGLLKINTSGTYYVHAQVELDNGTKISKTSGPYKIDLGNLPSLNAKLINKDGTDHNDWTNDDVILNASTIGTSLSGSSIEYMVGGHHTDWQPYKNGQLISTEGKKTVFVRVKDSSGKVSNSIELVSKIDKTESEVTSLGIIKNSDGNYSVEVKSSDNLSGIRKVKLNDGKVLNLTNSITKTYTINDLFVKPISLTVEDNAGNISKLHTFLEDIEVNYISDKGSTVRDDFEFEFTGSGELSYKVGNKDNICTENPCKVKVERNANIILLNKVDYKFSKLVDKVDNIDKSPLRLLLSGERDLTDETKISLNWNHAVTGGKIVVVSTGAQQEFTVNGTSAKLSVDNKTYSIRLKSLVGGKELLSNTLVIHPDYSKEIKDGLDDLNKYGYSKIFIEEDRIGTSYFVNTRKGDSEVEEVPLPDILFGK